MFDYNSEAGIIRMYGIIGDDISAADFMEALDAMDGKDVTIQLQSEGGDVIDGLSIGNQIEAYPGKVTVAIDALAASIATVFPMSADHIQAYENATIMIHRAWSIAAGNAAQFRVTADVLEALDWKIAGTYAKRTGGDAAKFLQLMTEETYFDTTGAKKMGLIDEIVGEESKRKKTAARCSPIATCRPAALAKYCEKPEILAKLPRPGLARLNTTLQSMELRLHSIDRR